MGIRVEEYVRRDGTRPFRQWVNGLDPQAAAKIATVVTRLRAGNTSTIRWFEGIGEARIDWGPGYRVYLTKDGETLIILLGGGTKRRQQADIETAKALHAEYKQRKAETAR